MPVSQYRVPAAAARVRAAAHGEAHGMLRQAVSLLDGVGPLLTLDDVNDCAPLEKFSWHGGNFVPTLNLLEAVVGRRPLVAVCCRSFTLDV